MHIHQWLCKLISDSNDKYEDNQLVSGWRGLEGTRSVGQCWAGVDTGAPLRRVRCHTQRARSIRPYLSHHQPADPATSHLTRDTWHRVTPCDTWHLLVTWPASAPWPPAGGCSRVTAATAGGTTDPSPAATRQTCSRRLTMFGIQFASLTIWMEVLKDLHWQTVLRMLSNQKT